MIIKSMSRKAPTFGQLAAYIARGADPQTGTAFVRNLYADGTDLEAVAGQFLDNYRFLPERKNGNVLYHELIALEPQPHLTRQEISERLYDLAEEYCARRAPRQLAWGKVHFDTAFPHIHLMISANNVRSDRRVRMERQYFAQVQRDLERWQEEHAAELANTPVYGRDAAPTRPRQTGSEGELVRRTGQPSAKQRVAACLRDLLDRAADRPALDRLLASEGIELYRLGRTWGVIVDGRRYRLKTLGVEAAFNLLKERSLESEPASREEALLRLRRDVEAHLRDRDRDDR